jgi:hypothetical protein
MSNKIKHNYYDNIVRMNEFFDITSRIGLILFSFVLNFKRIHNSKKSTTKVINDSSFKYLT